MRDTTGSGACGVPCIFVKFSLRENHMFTGIIETTARVAAIHPLSGDRGQRLKLELGELTETINPGASVAINGVCLTRADLDDALTCFDMIPETWNLTSLSNLQSGQRVNIERAMRLGDRLDGHFVQGHVDGCGRVARIDTAGEWKVWVDTPEPLRRYLVRKGSIAIDGVSLTIVDVTESSFSVALIPTTLKETTLGELSVGSAVNLETDILTRTVVDRLESISEATSSGLTIDKLRAAGFTA